MKIVDVFFESNNFVGREIENVQDLVRAMAAGMDIATDEECGYSTGYDDEDENGDWYWHEKTEDELFSEMKADLDNGITLYAGYFLTNTKYDIVPSRATTLQSTLYPGQEVYILNDNKIVKTKIAAINLFSANKFIKKDSNLKYRFLLENVRYNRIDGQIGDVSESFAILRGRYYTNNGEEKFDEWHDYLRPLSEVFPSKEKLFEYLAKDVK